MSEILQQAKEELQRKKDADGGSNAVIETLRDKLIEGLQPVMNEMVQALGQSLSNIKIEAPKIEIPPIDVRVPEITIPEIRIPDIKVPTINYTPPTVNVQAPNVRVDVPPTTISEVGLRGVDRKNPIPVMMMGTDGHPLMIPFGQGGSKVNFLTIKGMLTPNGDTMVDDSNDALRVNIVAGSASGATGSGEAAAALRVVHATDVATSVNVVGFTSSVAVVPTTAAGSDMTDETNDALRVNVVAGSLASNTQYNDTATPDQAGGTGIIAAIFDGGSVRTTRGTSYGVQAVAVSGFDGSLATVSGGALNVVQAASVEMKQVSGFSDSVNVVSFNSITPATGLNETNDGFLRVVQPTDFTGSVNVSLIGGIAPNLGAGNVGTGTVRVVVGADSTTAVVGDLVADAADTGAPPIKIGGIARTTNPTAVADGDRVAGTYDDLGRVVVTIGQVRDLRKTARATLTNGTETTLLAGASGVFYDMVYLMGANTSDVAVTVDIRAATAAGVVMTMQVPANGTAGVSLPMPIPQDIAADTWTADMGDITGTTVYLSALFNREV